MCTQFAVAAAATVVVVVLLYFVFFASSSSIFLILLHTDCIAFSITRSDEHTVVRNYWLAFSRPIISLLFSLRRSFSIRVCCAKMWPFVVSMISPKMDTIARADHFVHLTIMFA